MGQILVEVMEEDVDAPDPLQLIDTCVAAIDRAEAGALLTMIVAFAEVEAAFTELADA